MNIDPLVEKKIKNIYFEKTTNNYCIIRGISSFILFLIFKNSPLSERETIKSSQLNKQRKIANGEWLSNLDSLSGISVRENKIAFFKNMESSSDDIYEYQIIDSICQNNKEKTKIGEFLMMKDFSDTIYCQIINKNDSSLTLKMNRNKTETFKLKKNKK